MSDSAEIVSVQRGARWSKCGLNRRRRRRGRAPYARHFWRPALPAALPGVVTASLLGEGGYRRGGTITERPHTKTEVKLASVLETFFLSPFSTRPRTLAVWW